MDRIDGMDLLFGSQGGVVPAQSGVIDGVDLLLGSGGQSKNSEPSQASAPASGNLFSRAWGAIKGKQDPQFADTPDFRDELATFGFGGVTKLAGAKFAGQEDTAYGDILQNTLGSKFRRRFKDANGYDLIEFEGPDGQPRTRYVNKPGLDMEDVNRGAMGAVPYVAGGMATAGIKGLNLLGRAAAQAITAGLTSIGGDIAAAPMGSKQGIDTDKAGWAMLGGGVAEALPGKALAPILGGVTGYALSDNTVGDIGSSTALGAGTGYLAQAAVRRLFGMNPKLYVQGGKLTPAGEEAAKKAGLNPAEIVDDVAAAFGDAYARTRDASQAALSAGSSGANIPLSRGQRTRDYRQMVDEDAMRAGIKGSDASRVMQEFDSQQASAIDRAARGRFDPVTGKSTGIAAEINPGGYHVQSSAELGGSIRSGVQSARDAGRELEKKAWSEVTPLQATPEALAELPAAISNKIGSFGINEQRTPTAWQMGQLLEDVINGGPARPQLSVFGNAAKPSVNEIREQLGLMVRDAKTASDRTAAGMIYDGFNDWLMSAAKKNLLAGDPNSAAALVAARAVSREVKGIFEPMVRGRQTPGAQRLARVLDDNASPESLIMGLLGGVTTKATAQSGALEALQLLKTGLGRYGDKEVGRQTWNDIRHAYWLRIVQNSQGQMHSPTMIVSNFKTALERQGSIMKTLFDPNEVVKMKQFVRAVEAAGYVPPRFRTNSSGTSFAGGVMLKEMLAKLWEALGLNSRLATAAAQTVPGVRQWQAAGARSATEQTVPEIIPSLGGFGGAAGSATDRSR